MKTFIGITIGPIVDTLSGVKKTKALWGASYIFSYMMRRMCEELSRIEGIDIILPYYNNEDSSSEKLGVGIYPDRIILDVTGNESAYDKVKKLAEKLKKEVAGKIEKGTINSKGINDDEIIKYFNIYFTMIELDENETEYNPIFDVQKPLDLLELVNYPPDKYTKHSLFYFLENMKSDSFMLKEALESEKRKRFQSLPEIATNPLFKTEEQINMFKTDTAYEDKGEQEIDDEYREIKKYMKDKRREDKLKQYHKYIAIVQGDGDNISEVIKDLKTETEYQDFSKALQNFSKEASQMIRDYGGVPVYAGGDDLLFFAPIKGFNPDDEQSETLVTILDLLDKLDDLFRKEVKTDKDISISQSFGVSIKYIKHPLNEILDEARGLLFDKAKKVDSKNSIAIKVEKHSGQTFSMVFKKTNDTYYNLVKELLKDNVEDQKYIHGVHHKIFYYKDLLKSIRDSKDAKTRLEYFKENILKDDSHSDNYDEFLVKLEKLMKTLLIDTKGSFDEQINELDAILRFNHFLKTKMEGEDNI